MIRLIAWAALIVATLSFVAPAQTKYTDPRNGSPQPAYCNNEPGKNRCDCMDMNASCDDARKNLKSTCKTWCRPDDCGCASDCKS
jgi:hypothetical protein